ncbi:MAG: tetratricopeptide repeat protein, partial [Alistipes sp.]|nr:tetratricopeptide repeat protein [Alistipes sp.]
MKKYILLLVALCVSLSLSAQVDTAAQAVVEPVEETVLPATTEAMWDAANTAYINNEYGRARDIYEAILQRGEVSAKLYYNLANACFKHEELGQAILYYHRALRLAPGDADIRYNLSVAEARTKDTIDRIPEFF